MKEYLPQVGGIITMALGCLGLFAPSLAAKFTSIKPDGAIGISEIRATYGGFFLGMGASALLFNNLFVYFALGIAWITASFGRALSVVIDKSTSGKNIGGIIFETVIGLLFLANI